VWPGEGTINAKNAGKVDDKTINQIHVSQGKQTAVAAGTAALAIGGYYAAPYAVKTFGATKSAGIKLTYQSMNIAEKTTGVLASNPEAASITLGAVSGVVGEVSDLPPSTLPCGDVYFDVFEMAGTLLTRGVKLVGEEASAAWNSIVNEYRENNINNASTGNPQNIDQIIIQDFTQPADKTQHVKPNISF
jgi:hypothetical protein